VTSLNRDEREALALLTLVYPAGVAFTADRGEAIEVCEELVEVGYAVRVEGDDFPGMIAFQLSPEMAEAHRRVIANGADQAGMN
jgi:hypothetical protein